MSIEAFTWAIACEPRTPAGKALPTAKLVLMILANYAGQQGECFPGLRRLAEQSMQSENTVRARIDDLVTAGLVFRTFRIRDDGSSSSNEYVLLHDDRARAYAASRGWIPVAPRVAPAPSANAQLPLDLEPDDRADEGRGSNCSEGDGPAAWTGRVQLAGPLEPSLEPSKEPSPPSPLRGGVVGVDPPDEKKDLWFEFEPLYPWAENEPKFRARKAFDRLKRDEQLLAVAHARRYGDDCRARNRKICFAKTWLRDKGWEPYAALAAKAAAAGKVLDQVWVAKGTDAWLAWDAYVRATTNPRGLYAHSTPSQRGQGCFRSSLWPPGGGPPGPGFRDTAPLTMH